jgi:outer membrane protein
MKKVILIASLFLMYNFSNGQTQPLKLGHINSADLLQLLPEVKVADSTLQAYQKELEEQNTSMLAEYKQKTDDYTNNSKSYTDAVKEVKEQEIQDLQNRIQTFQQSAQDKLTNKKQEIYTPILKKAEDAIKEVAKANGYTYVFDTSAGAVVYAEDGDDLLPMVKKQLNLK